jgi:hypothetical protein
VTYALTGAPTSIAIAAADFLPSIEPGLTRDGPAFAWTARVAAADAIDLRVTWTDGIWDALLPADASTVTFPALQLVPATPADVQLRYLDASDIDGLSAIAEIFAEQTADLGDLLPVPEAGELAITSGGASL